MFDYSGFPPHTYELTWPAPGEPALAARITSLLAQAGIPSAEDAARGFDHGVFVPLKAAWPAAELPTVQLSLQQGLDPAQHLQIGQALAPLRDEGVLILGSGMSYHNLREMMRPAALPASQGFDEWLTGALAQPAAERDASLRAWSSAPHARAAHPREEHLLPLMVVAGAAGADPGSRIFTDVVLGAQVSAYQFGGTR